MDLGGVVSQRHIVFFHRSRRFGYVDGCIACRDQEANLSGRVRGNHRVGIADRRPQSVLAHILHQLFDQVEVKILAFSLSAEDTSSGVEHGVERMEELWLEENIGRSDGVRRVRDDDIEIGGGRGREIPLVLVANVLGGVVDDQCQARIIEGCRDGWEEGLAGFDDLDMERGWEVSGGERLRA